MTENQKTWLLAMFEAEIAQEEMTVTNEQAWADGAPDHTAQTLHIINVMEHTAYIDILKTFVHAIETEVRPEKAVQEAVAPKTPNPDAAREGT